jgi:signal transduction histidine kinase
MTVHEVHDPRLPLAHADPDLVSQALRNLLDNALRYAPAGAAVTVTAAHYGETVRVAVANTGGEIAAEDLPRIFERFYRGEKSRSRETGGAGIGLAFVQDIARAHGGEAGASSENGVTAVWFTLSLRLEAARGVFPIVQRPQRGVRGAG